MVNTNKILTVSYGTFSCTLEGFDDSFGTMKAIAEYFRDLAADDRYFGAEPPTPDAEMLARIAEREIARRVEAHFEENNIVLRAEAGSVLPVAPRDKDKAPAEAEPVAAEEKAEAPAAAAPTPIPAPVADLPEKAEIDAHADDSAETEALIEEAEAEEPETGEIAPEADMDTLRALVEESQPSAAAEDRIEEDETLLAADEAFEEETAEETGEAFFEAEPVEEAQPQPDTESVAAKLQRIRDVVSQHDDEEEIPAESYSEDEHAEDFLSEAHEEIEAALAIDDETEIAAAEEIAEDEDEDDIAALLSRFDTDTGDDEGLFDEDQEEDTAFAYDEAEEYSVDEEPEAPEADAEETTELRARVIKMKRSEFEAAIAEGHLEEDFEDEDAYAETGESDAEASLSPEDEADLLRELAAVEAELDTKVEESFADESEEDLDYAYDEEDVTAEAVDDLEEEAQATDMREAPFGDPDAEAEMGRIFEETNAHLDEETGKGRRNAIAHLRAAVAANKAERGAGGDLAGEGPDTEVYRDDLASVVRPRRPQAADGDHRTRRPETSRPAPLKLVAEQRVDLDAAEAAAPVRPRRVALSTAAAIEETEEAGNFAEYAEEMGANTLPELLEAAAAYLSFVEGREQFSRPQLMTHVRQVEQDEFSREDGLRSFGQLLREGKIIKLKGGRFAVSDSISYRPDARYAGE
ncbi:putative sodium/potassium/calcium exchanger [Marimonas lutisalis]|uniref:hypothetical protein n=1 Tax=Marimonas lutisalis TaxID=2545756 RepID=UPI0010F470DA|nr:hypothetical protein [Marimonas lutisalis]